MAEERLAKRQKTTSDFPVTYYDNIAADGHTHQHNGDQIFQGTVYMGSEKSTHQDRGQHLGERNNVVLDSLSFDHMDARYQAIDPSSAQTCRWLVEQPEYKRWRDPAQLEEHHGFLGIKGKAGAGKSTLMRHALDEHTEKKSKDEHVISFFFNARGADLEKSQLSMYRSLIHQMLQRAPWQQASLDPKRIAQARQEWTLPGLRNLFRELILKSKSCPLTCYIDALDECPLEEVIELIEFFEDLGDSCIERSRKCSVCFSSRHYPEVIIQYRELLILEDQPGHAGDIDRYVQRRLEVQNRTVKKDLTAQIRQRARGVFLWVVLTVRILNEAHRRGQAGMLRKCLDDIPQELTALFEDILSRGDTNANLIPLLQWLLYSTRPLKRAELYYALRSVQPFPKPPAEDESEFLDEPAMDRYILESSKGLVEFAKGQHARAQFIHESVRTYFAQIGLTNQLDIKEGDTLDARSHLQLRSLDAAALLIEYGADVNAQVAHSGLTYTALAAVLEEETVDALDTLTFLLDKGADFNAPCRGCRDALEFAEVSRRSEEVVDSLRSRRTLVLRAMTARE
ncbi:hypothetical protein B0A48_01169 [Cryoendolithus antarcticus]|uniref:Nephrocystin 3-like N-terminal domain-containing protein n=1 Tax=Cryoendolithus antarcticus TaxID=1507870 RepID=A0A1V8TSF4_9PEZI|nr:hypothetical protein B0A48_01169 [Cryoendolithus antarcticus]